MHGVYSSLCHLSLTVLVCVCVCVCALYTELVEGTARINEARLKRDVAEGKIIDFWRTERGYEVIRLQALNARENKASLHPWHREATMAVETNMIVLRPNKVRR